MKKVLISGANGFVGSHLVATFVHAGYRVFAAIRPGRTMKEMPSHAQVVQVDYLDKITLRQALTEIQPDVVVHCAGVTVSGRISDFHEGNFITTQNLVEICADIRTGRFVLISSLAARGPGERTVDQPVSAYGRSKLQAEQLVQSAGLPWTIIRPTAVYGLGDVAFRPLFQWARRGIFPRLGRADRRLTFVHVSDLCQLILAEVRGTENRLLYGWDGEVYQQQDVIVALRQASGKMGLIVPIPAFLFRGITGLLDMIIRRMLRLPWAYPPEKMKELLAKDWGIDMNERPSIKMRSLTDGFDETMKSYFS